MLTVTDQILAGTSVDAEKLDLRAHGVTALLNVAHDLQSRRGCTDGVLHDQCGIVDGPGTPPALYHAAALVLVARVRQGRRVLVYDHEGGRALAVAVWCLNLTNRKSWDDWLAFLRERHDVIREPHNAHREAFNRANWRLLSSVLEG